MLYQISNGAVAFGDDVILHSIDFEIRNTEKIAIVGRNGCGKTTLLKLISGEVEMEKLDSDESAFIAKAGNPEIGYLKQIAFDDPDVTLEQEVRKCFVKMDERKAEILYLGTSFNIFCVPLLLIIARNIGWISITLLRLSSNFLIFKCVNIS